jgi:hypothetical protein
MGVAAIGRKERRAGEREGIAGFSGSVARFATRMTIGRPRE